MRKYTCVVADDDPWALVDIRACIELCDGAFEIVGEARNAEKALELIAGKAPDLVITDICMGAMSGLDLIEECRRRKYEAVFMILSGYSEFEYARRAMRNMVNWYVLKPINPVEAKLVFSAIREALSGREPGGDALLGDTIGRVIEYMRQNIGERIGLTEVAERFFINRTYLSELFKRQTGKSFVQYKNELRLEKAKTLLTETDCAICDIAEQCGFSDAAYFSAMFKQVNGVTAQQYRNAHGATAGGDDA